MMAPILTPGVGNASRKAMVCTGGIMVAALAPVLLAGCVQVSAPERPIEINLNINIRQEVVVSLRGDVRELIEQNPGVF